MLDLTTITIVRRPGAWSNTTGKWVATSESTFTVQASKPQPVGPELIEMEAEGARATARFIMLVEDGQPDIILIDAAGANATDHVRYAGEEFMVAAIDNWENRPLGYKSYALLQVAKDE